MLYTDFIFKEFLYKFRRFFSFRITERKEAKKSKSKNLNVLQKKIKFAIAFKKKITDTGKKNFLAPKKSDKTLKEEKRKLK